MMNNVIKNIFIITVLVLLAGQVSAYTAEQQTIINGMNLSFRLGMAYQQAQQGQNVAIYNSLVDQYNAWVRKHFGEDAYLLMRKMATTNLAGTAQNQQSMTGNSNTSLGSQYVVSPYTGAAYLTRKPFNASSNLSKFGKQQVMSELPPGEGKYTEEMSVQRKLENF